MSSRQMQKLRKQQELLNLQKAAAAESDDGSDEPAPQAKPRGNVFSGFAALGDMGGDDDDEDDQESGKDDDKAAQDHQTAPSPTIQAPAKKSKKAKKKKKKGKKPEVQEPHDDIDDIDRVLEELQLARSNHGETAAAGSRSTVEEDTSEDTIRDLFQINFQHLKAMNEMRKLFGKAIHASNLEESAAQNAQPRAIPREVDLETYLSANQGLPTRSANAKPQMFDTVLKNNPFIEGKKTWPRGAATGLSMRLVTDNKWLDNYKADKTVWEYTFAHDQTYEALEAQFFQLVQMYDPMRIVHFLQAHPYHISSLIQVSKVAKQDQNSVLAADLIERALFTFGRVSLKEFRNRLEKGRVWMDFARPENRQFYLAGWHLIQHLALKGTYRTALEWTRLLLGLNHRDPYALINWAHVLAVRAHESQWFIDLCKSPLLDETKSGWSLSNSLYIKQTLALAYLQQGHDLAARAIMVDGLQRLPWLYCALFSALNIETPRSVWGIQPRDEDEELYTRLYVHMTKDLWAGTQIASLLKAAGELAQKPDINTLPRTEQVSLGTARFIYLEGNTDLMSAVPRNMLHKSPNFDFDPLPPPFADNHFSNSQQKSPWEPADMPSSVQMADIWNVWQRARGPDGPNETGDGVVGDQLQALAEEMGIETGGEVAGAGRGLLGRIIDILVRRGNVVIDNDFDGQRMPGGWGDHHDDDDEDELDFDYGHDDDDEFDEELPELEEGPASGPPRAMQATVEDAEEDSDDDLPDLENIPPGEGGW